MESIWLFTECVCVRLRSFIIFVWNMAVYCAFAYAHLAITFRYLPQVYIPINIWLCACVRTYALVWLCMCFFFAIINYVILTRTCARLRNRKRERERQREAARVMERIGVDMWRKRLNAVDHRSLLIVLPNEVHSHIFFLVISFFLDTQMISHIQTKCTYTQAQTQQWRIFLHMLEFTM